ncbi:uncharacterized protein LOC135461839 [Liolophura sinensis]|uniref:uncharacterized protein LOC135461839 n=1 Tax=Liolophura sinensis TaxID=3198878 RepID=UPI0031581B40
MVKLERYPDKPAKWPHSVDETSGPHLSPLVRKLFEAISKCQYKKLKYLLQNCCAKITSRNQYGHTVLIATLHIPDDDRRFRMFKYLIRQGANPLTKDVALERNCLLWACVLARCEETRYLLDEYAGEFDITEMDVDGTTALHHAVMTGSMDIVRMLIEVFDKFHVSVDIPNRLGLTPYMQARRLGHYEIAQVLKQDGRASPHRRDPVWFKTGSEWSQIGRKERQGERLEHLRKEIAWTKVLGRAPRLQRSYGLPIKRKDLNGERLPPIPTEEGESAILSELTPDGKSTSLSNRSLPENLLDRGTSSSIGQSAHKLTYSLMDMTEKGRRVKHFHKSESVDKSELSVLESLSSMLEVLVTQTSGSFRKSAERPEIVPDVIPKPKKPKVSSLAIVMGKKRGDRSRRSRLDRRDTQKGRLTVIEEVRPASKDRRGSKRNSNNVTRSKSQTTNIVSEQQGSSWLRNTVLPEINVNG